MNTKSSKRPLSARYLGLVASLGVIAVSTSAFAVNGITHECVMVDVDGEMVEACWLEEVTILVAPLPTYPGDVYVQVGVLIGGGAGGIGGPVRNAAREVPEVTGKPATAAQEKVCSLRGLSLELEKGMVRNDGRCVLSNGRVVEEYNVVWNSRLECQVMTSIDDLTLRVGWCWPITKRTP